MPDLIESLEKFKSEADTFGAKLVAISKTKPVEMVQKAYDSGHRDFGENKVQEMVDKFEALPKDINWHMVGHLQRNKVKYIAPFVHLIHGVDSLKLLREIEKQAKKANRTVNVLLQIHIAKEETKFGLSEDELWRLLNDEYINEIHHVKIVGLMGMATFTSEKSVVRNEFKFLHDLYVRVKEDIDKDAIDFRELSMGMSGDYKIALEQGSSMIRIGSSIFGERNYG